MLAVVGAALLVMGARLPLFFDSDRAQQLFVDWCDANGARIDAIGDQYAALRTNHDLFLSVGSGALSAAATLFLFGWINPHLRSPTRRWHFLLMGVAVLAWWWAGTIYGLTIDLERTVFPPCADTILIPMMGVTFLAVVLAVVGLIIGFLLSRSFGSLPVDLMVHSGGATGGSRATNAILGLIGFAIAILTVVAAFSADWSTVPAGIIAVFLVAATRAALIANKPFRL